MLTQYPPATHSADSALGGSAGPSTASLVVVVGMRREAVLARGPDRHVVIGAGDLGAVRAEATFGLLSFGLCGGLDPALVAGDLVIGSNPGCDPCWREALTRALPGARLGLVAGVDRAVANPAEKSALQANTGALAVDMETSAAARAAASRGLPFAILRAVSDPASRRLPRAALAGLSPDGSTRPLAVLAALARRPWELPTLIRVAVEAERAFRSLRDARDLLGPRLGCPYLG